MTDIIQFSLDKDQASEPKKEMRPPQEHRLKVWPGPYKRLAKGFKRAEIRYNDRDFRVGDILVLQEWRREGEEYTGRKITMVISDITGLSHWGASSDPLWVVLHLVGTEWWLRNQHRR